MPRPRLPMPRSRRHRASLPQPGRASLRPPLFCRPEHNRIFGCRLLHFLRVVYGHATLHWSTSSGVISMTGIAFSWIGSTMPLGSVVMIENSVWSPMLGTFLVPRSPVHGRQIPANKNGCLSVRSNKRHTTAPFGVILSGSKKAVARTTQRCLRSSQSRHRRFFRLRICHCRHQGDVYSPAVTLQSLLRSRATKHGRGRYIFLSKTLPRRSHAQTSLAGGGGAAGDFGRLHQSRLSGQLLRLPFARRHLQLY